MDIFLPIMLCGSILSLILYVLFICYFHVNNEDDVITRAVEKIVSAVLLFLMSWCGVVIMSSGIYNRVKK